MAIFKRGLSLFLSLVLVFCMVPVVSQAEEEAQTQVDSGDVTVEGTNSVGTLLSEEIQEYQEADETAGGYNVVGLTIEDGVATAEFRTLETAILMVGVYTEDGMQLLLSGKAEVQPNETEVNITLEGSLPEYFVASAYLVDTYDYSPLCTAYETVMYTQEMQELLASTVDDYDPDLVLNLDDSTETNFAVFEESTVILEEQEGVNTVASVDDENATYVIENADETITALTAGDIFALPYGENDILIVKVATITVTGTTATITGSDVELEEVFSHVKLENTGDASDIVVDESTAEEGVVFEGLVEDDSPATRALDGEPSWKNYLSFKLVDYAIETESNHFEGSVKLNGSVGAKLDVKISYYVSWSKRFIELKIDAGLKATISVSGEAEGKVSLPKFKIKLHGVSIGLKPELQLEFSGKLEYSITAGFTLGFSYENKKGFKNLCTTPMIEFESKVEGSIFFGIDFNPNIKVLGGVLAEADSEMLIGVELKAEPNDSSLEISGQADTIHACEACLKIDINFVAKASVTLKFLKSKKLTLKSDLKAINVKIGDLYWSIDRDEFDWGTCPYEKYRVTVQVKNSKNENITNVEVFAKCIERQTEVSLGSTNSEGTVVNYLQADTYTFYATVDEELLETEATIKEATKINLNKNAVNGSTCIPGITNTDSVTDVSVVAKGTCGDNLTWKLDNTGTLTISGTGAMEEWAFWSDVPWYTILRLIRKVIVGDGVTTISGSAFYGCTSLSSVTIADSVTNIGIGAFSNCTALTSITIPDSVTSIGGNAFKGTVWYNNLPDGIVYIGKVVYSYKGSCPKTITIKDGTLEISGHAFDSCTDLTTVIIPNSVTSIGDYAFYKCSSLTTITIPNSVTSIGDDVFTGCIGLISITIPNSVTSMGDNVFSGCTNLTAISIPKSLTSISNSAFYGCTGLTTIMIPNSVISIGYNAFYRCTSLKSVIIPNSVTSIGGSAFENCTGLTSLTIPNSVTSIDSSAFSGCTDLASIAIPNSVTSIGSQAFYNCTNLTTIMFPDSAISIESSAFDGTAWYNNQPDGIVYAGKVAYEYKGTCPEAVTIKEGTLAIGAVFDGCTGLTMVTIPNSVSIIGADAFSGCTGLTMVTIPNSVSIIGIDAFSGCTGLTSITIPNSVTSINHYAFSNCTGLTTVTISNRVTSIGGFAFSGCTGLTSIAIPDSVIEIDDGAFQSCTGLTVVTIPDNVTRIGIQAFYNCTGLTSVTIPDNVTSIGGRAFSNCGSLTGIWVDENNKNYSNDLNGCLFNKDKTVLQQAPGGLSGSYIIPDSVNVIGEGVFTGCTSLTSVTIPDSVTTIGGSAFERCTGLTTVTIPTGVTKIYGAAFYNCTNLDSVTFEGNLPSIAPVCFYNVTATAYYPAGNSTWPSNIMQNYDGNITWVAYNPAVGITAVTKKPATRAIYGGEYDTEVVDSYTLKTASFSGLVAGEEYLLLALGSLETEELLAADNLLAIDQGKAGEDGTLVFEYVQRVDTPVSYVMACGASKKNLLDAEIKFPFMNKTDEVKAVDPVVTYDGIVLTEGVDYTIVGTVDYTTAGTFTCYVRGIYNYTGLVECTYTVENTDLTETEDYLYMTLNADCQTMPELTKDLYVDLNGFDLTGTVTTNGYKVYGMDSTTDSYTCEAIGYMNLVDENGNAIVPVTHFKSDITGQTCRYMAIKTDQGYSFHRFYLGITHQTLKPTTTGVGYKAVFYGDSMVAANLDSFGFVMTLGTNTSRTFTKTADQFVSGKTVTLRIDNFDVENHGETELYASVMLQLADGTRIETDQCAMTMRSLLETLNTNYTAFTADQLKAVADMINKFAIISTWKVENLI